MSEFKPGQGMNDLGGFAFPLSVHPLNAIDYGGMMLRDYFAAKAMQAMMTSPELMVVVTADKVLGENAKERISTLAYKYADAMLKAREK